MKEEENKITQEPEINTDVKEDLSSEALAEEDVVFEDNTEVTGADYTQMVKKLKERIKELEKKNAELLDGWQRDKADFINTRKRDDGEKQEFLKFAKADIISEIIPVLDSFDSAFKNKEVWEKVDKNWRTGVEYINSQLHTILAQHGLKVINPVGLDYDHARDEAIETVPAQSKDFDGKILEVMAVGYELNGKEIRPPKVKVGQKDSKL